MATKLSCIIAVLFFAVNAYCAELFENENFILSADAYLRQDLVTFNNIADLDSVNKDDKTAYIAVDYSVGIKGEFKDAGWKLYLKLERNGPYDYGAPLFIDNTLMNSGGRIEAYRNDELLPQLEEFWLDLPLWQGARFKSGLYSYEVGRGFSLSGGYENLGITIFKEEEASSWRLYYCRPDIEHKNHLGPRIRQDEEQGILYEPGAVNFFAGDVKFGIGDTEFNPYIGVLADYTPEGKRSNFFTPTIKRDILATLGMLCEYEKEGLSLALELAHNLGKAESDSSDYKDIYHSGYLIFAEASYKIGKFTPLFQMLVSSGNKVTLQMAVDGDTTLLASQNRAFSYASPLNDNISDSISSSNVDMLPIVAMGGGYGLNYGIPRPGTFASGDFDNLIMPSLGFEYQAGDKLTLSLYAYYLRSFERGVATLNGEGIYLSRDLGYEMDWFVDYQLNDNLLISFLGGCFFPGRYHKQLRDDTGGSIFSPYVRGDAEPDNAYQLEIAFEWKF